MYYLLKYILYVDICKMCVSAYIRQWPVPNFACTQGWESKREETDGLGKV